MTLMRMLVRRAAHAGLADFGICLIRPPTFWGCEKTGDAAVDMVDSDDVMTAVEAPAATIAGDAATADDPVDEADASRSVVPLVGCVESGGLSEPGHRFVRGPWR